MSTALRWFAEYGYIAVFFPVMLELVGIPFPSETILLAAGATAALHRLSLPVVIGFGIAGAIAGGFLGYAVGGFGGRPLIGALERRRLLRREHVARVEDFYHQHGGKTLLAVRFIPGVRIPAFWLAGSTRMKPHQFTVWNAAGAVVWVLVITLAGYAFAGSVGTVDRVLGRDAAIATAAVVVLLAAGIELRRRLRRPQPEL